MLLYVLSLPERRSQVHSETLSRKTSWTSSVYDESGLERKATLRNVKKLPGRSTDQQQYIYVFVRVCIMWILDYPRGDTIIAKGMIIFVTESVKTSFI